MLAIDSAISDAFSAAKRPEWKTNLKAVIAYRKALLVAQEHRCAYCARTIRDEVGHRELEHILPQSQCPAQDFDGGTAASNDWIHRRHTRGYGDFRYEPLNLALSCKRCNSYKGSFDPLLNRSVAIAAYPSASGDYLWVHPHFDPYSKHINILEGLLYSPVQGSQKGQAVIKVCGLDRAEEITARQVEACLTSTQELVQAMISLTISGEPLDSAEVGDALHKRFKVATSAKMKGFLDQLLANAGRGSDVLVASIKQISLEIGTGNPIVAPTVPAFVVKRGAAKKASVPAKTKKCPTKSVPAKAIDKTVVAKQNKSKPKRSAGSRRN
ncbi:MAG: hypothetical protein CVU22_09595 [Betaproteobacteria bacterium HGW-Betaproteobacteria-16]|nr:MAG: hypothetical protein CVU22_09595 [Betaproteobacteria bacterium HGW-Betaproteobacteria-16]